MGSPEEQGALIPAPPGEGRGCPPGRAERGAEGAAAVGAPGPCAPCPPAPPGSAVDGTRQGGEVKPGRGGCGAGRTWGKTTRALRASPGQPSGTPRRWGTGGARVRAAPSHFGWLVEPWREKRRAVFKEK